jgi:hypothetical protein
MSKWLKEELGKISDSDDLQISPFREDGKTYGTPTWIWSVVVRDDLYVRAYYGQNSSWYKAAVKQKAGRIYTAGMTKDVAFEPVKGAINDRVNDAYMEKYKGNSYLNSMINDQTCATTLKVIPKE